MPPPVPLLPLLSQRSLSAAPGAIYLLFLQDQFPAWLKPFRKPLVALIMDYFNLHFNKDEPTGTLQ